MKKILITGANSYIGTSFEKYIKENFPGQYEIDTADMIGEGRREKSFSGYDSVFHVAGIAHQKETKENAHLYYEINRDLAVETAKKAKADGVCQFVFLSSMSVYGMNVGTVTVQTVPTPKSNYGKSKLQAEEGILPLSDENFKVCILRPPMVYGNGCKGNYPMLAKIALKTPIFPYVKNERSMLYIENLCEFVRLMIENGESGTFWPQNAEYSNTSELVKMIAAAHGKRVRLMKGFGWVLKLLGYVTPSVNKAFGSLQYETGMSEYRREYANITLNGSIKLTENAGK